MNRQVSRIAVVNRGEAAMRLVNGVRELREEGDAKLVTIALHTTAERRAMFVREADEAVAFEAVAGNPYLDFGALERALVAARADAAWVGWGFVAERPEFAELCDRLGIVFVGPSAEVMRRLGNKIGAKLLAESAGVPVAPWSGGPVTDAGEGLRHAEAIGFPLMVKAAAGGGGRGIRLVTKADELADAVERASAEAGKAFGDATVFLERVVTDARHVEVQVIADDYGTVWAVGVRDCSVQRRNQKVIEESSSTVLTADQEQELGAAAARLCAAAGYRNAGTVEFLYQPASGQFAFLEVNTRLQVEHPVTEVTTGLDLVKLQLFVAGGGRLEGTPPAPHGHAIEARLNAEDPQRGFAPSPGTVTVMEMATGPGVRVDTGVAEGDVIPPEYDSMIAKVIAWGHDRSEARARLRRALGQSTVLVSGGTTNKSFLLDILDRPELRIGSYDTGWLDRLTAAPDATATEAGGVALMAAAVNAYDAEAQLERDRFLGSASRGRPSVGNDIGHEIDLRHGGNSYRVHVARGGPGGWYRLGVDGDVVDVLVERLGRSRARLAVGARMFRIVSSGHGPDHLVEVDGDAHRFSQDDGGVVRAPAAAVVVSVAVAPGDTVTAGTRLLLLEAMKMEVAITAPVSGTVGEVLVTPNVQVEAGAPLLRLEPSADADDAPAVSARLRVPEPVVTGDGDERGRCLELLAALRSFVLGYDLLPADAVAMAEDYRALRSQLSADETVVRTELEVLGSFADLSALTRERREAEEADTAARAAREWFNIYLRSLDAEREGLPDRFRQRLSRALAHYGVPELDRTPELEEALYRIFQAQQRRASQVAVVLALLEAQRNVVTADAPLADDLRDTLDRLAAATQLRFPVVGDLARSVRYLRFDQPVITRARDEVLTEMGGHLAYLKTHRDAPDYAERVERLVSCPQPLIRLLADGADDENGAELDPMLEVLTRRYYKVRALRDVRPMRVGGEQVLLADYRHRERNVRVIVARATLERLDGVIKAVQAAAGDATAVESVVVDFYIVGAPPAESDRIATELSRQLDAANLPPTTQRVHLVWYERGEDGAVRQLTFRRRDDEFQEERVFRGLHPMIARRLRLWRLSNFVISRLSSADDVYVFACVARQNRADERLIAVAEVRDLTPLRDASGRVTSLPELELVLGACLDGIRRARSDQPRWQRLEWNRVMLYVWPPVTTPLDELVEVARRLAPLTEGLGLEQVVVHARVADDAGGEPWEVAMRLGYQPGRGLTLNVTDTPTEPMQPLDDYAQKVVASRRRGAVYPYELVGSLAGPGGSFVEHDLDDGGHLVPVDRPAGTNGAGVVVGVTSTPTERHPEGMARVAVLGDPTKALGSIAEPECRRLLAAIELADERGIPIEWFALSAGAKIAMDSGTENLDWVARVLRRIVEFTQTGGEVNVVVAGINVGAQPYWNAEATMMMHTTGILVMVPESAMVLTGKQALDYSGGVSAEDNAGIGGYERIMGPNGESQYWAADLPGAVAILFSHYEHSYLAPGERFPRRANTVDPLGRDVRAEPHPEGEFTTVGDIFSDISNPDRKKPFDIRALMRATIDHDLPPLERWPGMVDAETAVVFDAHLGGYPVTLIGIESKPLPRYGPVPADGPNQWSAGTLFPLSSKKVARAINSASGNRPVVVLANLSGFDGSPESLRRLQLEYGAEIGRAIVNFDGPIVLCVVSRYHGGAFVVFSGVLNDNMEVLAVEGSFASVIGGAPAAAVVFTGEIDARTKADPRVTQLEKALAAAAEEDRAPLRTELAATREAVRMEKLGMLAAEFDAIHSVERARAVGSVHRIVPAKALRPALIEAVERGVRATLDG